MRTKVLVPILLLLAAGAVGVSEAAIRNNKGALVMVWITGAAETRANVIAAGAGGGGGASGITPTDFDFLPPGDASPNAPNGLWVHSEDTEFNAGMTNSATATARYNRNTDGPPGTIFTDLVVKGVAGGGLGNSRDGFGVTAIGDTAIDMSFTARVVPTGGTTANLILNGTALVQRTIPAPGVGTLDIIVYPDSVTANLDPANTGAGAVFKGRLVVDKDGIEKADGGLAPGDFAVQLTAARARVTATGVTKPIVCPNSALLSTMMGVDSSAAAVPGHTPLMVGVLSLLMAGAGFMALRRTRLTA